jgi:cytochrome c-type biogenesis protein CcmH
LWLAILADRDDRKTDAEQIYRQMLSENIPGAWKAVVNERLEALNALAANNSGSGVKNRQASGDVLRGDQRAMIRGMVERLATRLKADLEGWLKLIRSYAVLKETDKAQEAAASAREQFASDAQALSQIETLAQGLGLTLPDAKGGQPKS